MQGRLKGCLCFVPEQQCWQKSMNCTTITGNCVRLQRWIKLTFTNEYKFHLWMKLGSTKTIIGYQIHASDGDFGHVSDFIFDDANWQIMNLEVDTHNWFGGKKTSKWNTKNKKYILRKFQSYCEHFKEAINNCPVFDESQFYTFTECRHSFGKQLTIFLQRKAAMSRLYEVAMKISK